MPTEANKDFVEFDKPREKCGIFGIYNPNQTVAYDVRRALVGLQHRGEEAAGIAVSNGNRIVATGGKGSVKDVLTDNNLNGVNDGPIGLGHVRYSTTENGDWQPISKPEMALGHNGNLISIGADIVLDAEAGDTQILANRLSEHMEASGGDIVDALRTVLPTVEGAYSLVVSDRRQLIAVRDPRGFRPLVMGRRGDAVCFASETGAIYDIGAEPIRHLDNGEMMVVNENGITSERLAHADQAERFCLMEFVYFMREDAMIGEISVGSRREQMGEQLALEASREADLVVGVPGTARDIANGYSRAAGVPIRNAIIKNSYVGRSFTQPTQELREARAEEKFNILPDMVRDQRIIVIDDSIVRGTNTRKLVEKLRHHGAREIHFMVASPPYRWPCYYGIDTGKEDELVAKDRTVEEIAEYLGVDSLNYLSLEGLKRAIDIEDDPFCDACLTGDYPTAVPVNIGKTATQIR